MTKPALVLLAAVAIATAVSGRGECMMAGGVGGGRSAALRTLDERDAESTIDRDDCRRRNGDILGKGEA